MKTESKILLNDSIIKPRKKVFGENYERHCNKDLRKAIKAIYVYIYIKYNITSTVLLVANQTCTKMLQSSEIIQTGFQYQ